VSPEELENILRDLPRVGSLVKDRGYRQVWRFEYGGKGYYLKYYPREGSRLKRLVRGNPALREFVRLQWLQKAQIPAPRAVAHLNGFRLNGQIGDAAILEAIEPAVALDQYLNDFARRGEVAPDYRRIVDEVLGIVNKLAKAGLGHGDLHLGNFLLKDGKLYLLDAYAVRAGGMREKDLLQLGHSVNRHATVTDLQRGWDLLGPGGAMPRRNPIAKRQWRKFLERAAGDNQYFGQLAAGEWSGIFFKHFKFPRRWASVSAMTFTDEDWEKAWPDLLARIESDSLEVLKRSKSGDVLAGEMVVGGRPISVVVKRPRRRYWYRYINEIGRGGRARRAWYKAWNLIARDLPTAWPLMVMEKRIMGYVTDSVFVCQRVPGPTLASANLDEMSGEKRERLFRRTGRILRRIEQYDFSHFDAKASNWIVEEDPLLGPTPVLIDVDGVRRRKWTALGIRRLLRAMREHPQYAPTDSLALCRGYAPYSRMVLPETQS
jgi:tRNA A-37 threonylcarbamoyl transferase component Bud32